MGRGADRAGGVRVHLVPDVCVHEAQRLGELGVHGSEGQRVRRPGDLVGADARCAGVAGGGPTEIVDDLIEICHGTPFDEDAYVFDDLDALRAMHAARRPLCLFGHTHVQVGHFLTKDQFGLCTAEEQRPLKTPVAQAIITAPPAQLRMLPLVEQDLRAAGLIREIETRDGDLLAVDVRLAPAGAPQEKTT